MHYYKRNLGDYSKKAGRLSILQHGVYNLLIDACYDREKFPTLEDAIDWTWAGTTEEIEAVKFVLSKFFKLENGVYVQSRIQEEIAEYHNFCAAQEAKGKLGGRPKGKPAGKENKPDGLSEEADGNPSESQRVQEITLTTNHYPLTSITDTSVSVVGAKAPPACPHLEIIALYNRILPELQHVMPDRWDGARANALRARWRETPKHQRLVFWERFFTELRNWPFYMGENDRGWKADLGWIVKRINFDKLLEKFTDGRREAA